MLTEVLLPHKLSSFEKIEITIHSNAGEASEVVAAEIAALIKQKQRNGQRTVLGLATGSTPKKVYAALIRLHKQKSLSFKNVAVFKLDEYNPLQPDALQSYRRFMEDNLFNLKKSCSKGNAFSSKAWYPMDKTHSFQ